MSIREDKERLIKEIQKLRALVSGIKLKSVQGSGNLGSKIDEIHNRIFGI